MPVFDETVHGPLHEEVMEDDGEELEKQSTVSSVDSKEADNVKTA